MHHELVASWLQGAEPSIWLHGNASQAITPANRGLLFADGVFSTLRLHHGKVFLWDYHWARLQQAVDRLGLAATCLPTLAALFDTLLPLLQTVSVGAKVVLVRAEQAHARGYAPAAGAGVHLYIQLFKLPAQAPTLAKVGLLAGCLGRSGSALAGLKTLARTEQVLFAADCIAAGWNEGLLQDHDGNIIEATAHNVFVQVNGQWLSPNLARGYGVAGVMRQYLLDCFVAAQIIVQVQDIKPALLQQCEAMLLTNAVHGYRAVQQLVLPNGSIKPLNHDYTKHTSLPKLPWL